MLSGSVCLNIYNTTQTDTGLMIISLYMLCLFIYEANENKAWNEPFRWLFKSGITSGCSVGNVTDMISTGGFSAFFKLSFFFHLYSFAHREKSKKRQRHNKRRKNFHPSLHVSKEFKEFQTLQLFPRYSDDLW